MNYFSEIFGLVTRHDSTTENGGLFFAHYLVLKDMAGSHPSKEDQIIFETKMSKAQVDSGLYLRSYKHRKRTVSQDEQTGFSITSYLLGDYYGIEIWNYLLSHFGNYPATGKLRIYNPGSYYSWAVLAHSKISFLFAPFYTINLLISSNKPPQDTSSKLMYLSELYCAQNETIYCAFLYKYFSWRMEIMYGHQWIQALYDIYFSTEESDHPLIKLSRGL